MIALIGGPAGAGKSTLARVWCATRPRADGLAWTLVVVVPSLAETLANQRTETSACSRSTPTPSTRAACSGLPSTESTRPASASKRASGSFSSGCPSARTKRDA